MKYYYSKGDNKFDVQTIVDKGAPNTSNVENPYDEKYVKIRITHVMPYASDVNIFYGDSSVKYPFILGHAAIGVLSQEEAEFSNGNQFVFDNGKTNEHYKYKRGTKVILNPFYKDYEDYDKEKQMGVDTDGFMRDYIYMPESRIIPFPGQIDENGGTIYSLKEEEAILTEKVALALKTISIEGIQYQKNKNVVIIGANALGNIIAQLIKYKQMNPILVDSNEENLKLARSCGILNTINETKEQVKLRVHQLTGGRNADITILVSNNPVAADYALTSTGENGDCIIVNENKILKKFNADISLIGKNNIRVFGVSDGRTEFLSAIDILNRHILKTDEFIERNINLDDVEILFRELRSNPDRYFLSIIKMTSSKK
ncbi:MAG: zinc-binding dehydrogenase [Clostridia bacterium]|nr:zinc-binding dehydrogenase [Clostridia bacterium]